MTLSFQNQKSILSSALDPDRLPVMLEKIRRRFFDKKGSLDSASYKAWLAQNATPVDEWCRGKNPALWGETQDYVQSLFSRFENEIKPKLPPGLGHNACVKLLYFVTRTVQPKTIVETGVALGFSSQTFLYALKKNGGGKLYSSDFPYFRMPDAEKYIGIVVEEKYRPDWDLHIDGDRKNIPAILGKIDTIDLFHYDSDKTYAGREFAYKAVRHKFTPGTVIVFDDIQDASHFHDLVSTGNFKHWQVLENRGGYVGLVNFP